MIYLIIFRLNNPNRIINMNEIELDDHLPFISVMHYSSDEYVGVIINQDAYVTSFYDLSLIKIQEQRIRMMELCELWWYESNHRIPINIFLRNELDEFRFAIKTLSTKDVTVVIGPVVNLTNISERRPKRRTVQLIRNPKS